MHFPEAFWAASSAWAAWTIGAIGLLLNAAGIYLLIAQLKANQIALKATAESAEAATEAARLARLDTRPWLKPILPGQVQCALLRDNEASYRLRFHFPLKLENVGRTPALMVSVTAQVIREPSAENIDHFLGRLAEAPIRTNSTVFPADTYGAAMDLNASIDEADFTSQVRIVCAALVTYREHPNGDVLSTPIVMSLSNIGASDPPAFRTLRPAYGLEAVALVPYVFHTRAPT